MALNGSCVFKYNFCFLNGEGKYFLASFLNQRVLKIRFSPKEEMGRKGGKGIKSAIDFTRC